MSVLVLGGTGNLGPHVVRALLDRGADVRVLTRDPDRAATVLGDGPSGGRGTALHVVGGDPLDDETVRAAASGTTAMFLLTGHGPAMAAAQLQVLRALRHTDTPIVKLSATDATVSATGPGVGRQHWKVEQILAAEDRPHAVLRPNAFVQGIVQRMIVPAVVAGAPLVDATAGTPISLVDARDVGEAAAAVLLDAPASRRTYVLTGPRAVSLGELAGSVAARLGRPAPDIVPVTPAEAEAGLVARGLDPWEAEHLAEMYEVFRSGGSTSVTDTIAELLGRPARDPDAAVADLAAP